MTRLRLAGDLALPVDAVTQTFLIVGKRGSGKSNTAARFVEQLHHAGLPFVVLDPVDTWWGLKAGLAGGPGLNVYVFGGAHADLPLQAGDGALLAEVLCEHRMPMVLSVKHLSGRARSDFMVAFAQTLFQKWAGGPLHLVLEEAHELAPQSAQHGREGEQQMLGAFKRLWKLGRASGIGGSAITQRPASLSKDITTQSEILIAHRTIGPQDVKAVGEWVKYHGERLDMLAELPSLPTGEAFVWAPEFPEGKAIGLTRSKILLRETYDSASTPKVGERRVEPKELAPVDLERLRAKMSKTIEKAKADDPKLLRARIAELERAAKNAPKTTVEKPVVDQDAIDRAVAQERARTQRLIDGTLSSLGAQQKRIDQVRIVLGELDRDLADIHEVFSKPVPQNALPARTQRVASATSVPRANERQSMAPRVQSGETRSDSRANSNGSGKIGKTHREILNALAGLAAIGKLQPEKTLVAAWAGRTYGGTFSARLSELRTAGLIADVSAGSIELTSDGAAVGDASGIRSREDLHEMWRKRLGSTGRAILTVLIERGPDKPISKQDLAACVGQVYGGTFSARLSEVRSPGLVKDAGRGEVVGSDVLFPEGLD